MFICPHQKTFEWILSFKAIWWKMNIHSQTSMNIPREAGPFSSPQKEGFHWPPLSRQGLHLQFNTNLFINIMVSHKIEFSAPCIATAIKTTMHGNACTQAARVTDRDRQGAFTLHVSTTKGGFYHFPWLCLELGSLLFLRDWFYLSQHESIWGCHQHTNKCVDKFTINIFCSWLFTQ